MKKQVFLWLLLFSLLFCLVSCGKNENPLIGRWQSTDFSAEVEGKVTLVYHFTEEGRLFLEAADDASSFSPVLFGSYSVENDTLRIESEEQSLEYRYEILEDRLILFSKTENLQTDFIRLDP